MSDLSRSMKDIGKSMLREAEEKLTELRRESAVQTVADLLQLRDNALTAVDQYLQQAEWFQDKIRAVNKGKFTLHPDGKIHFHANWFNSPVPPHSVPRKYFTIDAMREALERLMSDL